MTDTVDSLLASLDLPAKILLISGSAFFRFAGDPDIGLAEMPVSDGPSGVRGEHWDERDSSVSLPSGTALAATWDRELLSRVGGLIAAEARRKDVYAVLGPTINLQRSPIGGRHFECLSEDPLLTAEIADAYVRSVQAHGVSACPKHYVANDSETDRFTVDVQVSDRALREVYLYPFERSVQAGAWMLMAAYNAVNGATMTENRLLDEPLKGEWGFDGVVVSDWSAIRSTAAAADGCDVAMPGPARLWGAPLLDAVRAGRIPESAIDDKVRRILRFAQRVGALDDPAPVPEPFTDAAAQGLVREAAAKAMVLVRNDGVLPLANPARVALLGTAAGEPRYMGGGSATVIPSHTSSPLDGLSAILPVTYVAGVHAGDELSPVPTGLLTDPATGRSGLSVRYLDGEEIRTTEHRTASRLMLFSHPPAAGVTAVEVHGRLRADVAGDWQIGVAGVGAVTLTLNGDTVLDELIEPTGSDPAEIALKPPQRSVTRGLAAGEELDIVVRTAPDGGLPLIGVTLVARRPQRTADEEFAAAVEAARTAEVGDRRGRHHRADRIGGLRPHRSPPARTAGRARRGGGRRQPTHRGGGELRLAGRDALARRRRRHPADLVPRSGVRLRAGRRADRPDRTRRPPAEHLAGDHRRRARAAHRAGRRPDTRVRRGHPRRLPRVAEERRGAGVPVRSRSRLHQLAAARSLDRRAHRRGPYPQHRPPQRTPGGAGLSVPAGQCRRPSGALAGRIRRRRGGRR